MPVSAVRVLRVIAGEESTDAELLARFVDRRDEAAFALLVRRHGAMVYGVCRRMLPEQDAEDAFQATFLVLAEKARTAAPREVANWLYGVARRAALLARRSIARRRERTGEMPDRLAPEPTPMAELRAALDEELSRLPDMYRTVIVLCDLEGRTRREASAELGWPEGTVAGRLARARELLAKRLARHATTVSVAAVLAGTSSARVPEVLSPSAVIPSGVAALTRKVLGVMARGKLMKVAAAIFLLGCAGFGMVLAGQKPATKPALPGSAEVPMNPQKADDVAWGPEVDGLQIGITGLAPAYRHGDKAKMEVKLRNVGKADVTVTHGRLQEHTPDVTTGGEQVTVAMPLLLGIKVRVSERVIKPGETVTLYHPEVVVEGPIPDVEPPFVDTPTIRVAPGKYKIGYGGVLQSHPKLATGTVAFEVKAKGAPDEAFAWGAEVDGLRAGIAFGETKSYRIGEKVTPTVRVRNVGKATVEYSHFHALFRFATPAVLDAGGRRVAVIDPRLFFSFPGSKDDALKPGEAIDFGGAVLALDPPGDENVHSIRVGPGKYTVGYANVLKSHPKLATGAAEFEVKDAKEAVTAWGKEIGGLQAGLSVGEKRVYRHGETVTAVLKMRNVGKDEVEFKHIWAFFVENPPTVADADGKLVRLPRGLAEGLQGPRDTKVAPGKEVDLYTWEFDVRPKGERGPSNTTIQGTGTFSLQCEHVVGPTSGNPNHPNPAMDKLATGKLEIEVVAPEVRLPGPEPDVQEVSDPLPIVRGPLQKDGARALKARKDVVGKPVCVEGIGWGQPFGLKGQEGTVSPHAGPHVVYEGGSVFVRGIDFTETKARGKPVRVTGTLRFEPRTATRWGEIKGYYYIEATKFEVIDAVADPYLVYLEK